MATQNKFVVEYGVSVGTTEVINSSGKIVAGAISELTTDNLAEGNLLKSGFSGLNLL